MVPCRLQAGGSEGIGAMMPVIEYIHAIHGRIRVKVPEVKRSLKFAQRIEGWLGSFEGIHEVRANPVTGNVLILHDPDRIAAREILGALIAAGYMGMGIATTDEAAAPETAVVQALQVVVLLCQQVARVLAGFTPGPGWVQQLVETAARFVLRLAFGKLTAALA